MKNLIAVLVLSTITLASSFAAVTSFNGSSQTAPSLNVTLKSTLDPINYTLSLNYGLEDFTSEGSKTITGLDLTNEGSTDIFNVIISNGNLNKSITFNTEITELPFVGTVDGKTYTTKNNLTVKNSETDAKQNVFTTEVPAGPQETQSVAKFKFHWDADKSLPAGDYVSTNKISISVN